MPESHKDQGYISKKFAFSIRIEPQVYSLFDKHTTTVQMVVRFPFW
jgi:hypothetical protein